MSRVVAGIDLPGVPVADAEALWYDRTRWPAFIDGLHEVEEVQGPYPEAGSRVVWSSHPAGRGRVTEEVLAYTPGAGQEIAVSDPQITGRQRVVFAELPGAGGTSVVLELDYRLRGGGPLGTVTDRLFIRRAQGEALRRTLVRLRQELEAGRPAPDGPRTVT